MSSLNQPNPSADPVHPWLSRLVGENQRYRLEKYLGGGGMGDVFLATDTKLGLSVALKLLKESLSVTSDDIKKRFEREFAICAALKSPHIVQVLDYGVTPEGYSFYVMEYLNGQTLGQLLRLHGRLSHVQTNHILTQICAGLQLAHEGVVLWSEGKKAGEKIKVVHRDLKPDNIFLVPTALGDLVKIIDFGIAKIRSLQTENTNVTSVFIGTCRYAAPEQIEADIDVDERADIYSLGMILYQMLAGCDPFGFALKNQRISEASWTLAHVYQPPQPLRSWPNCEQISPEIEAVVMRCLEKSPQDRFASVKELSQAMQVAVTGVDESTIATTSTPERSSPATSVTREKHPSANLEVKTGPTVVGTQASESKSLTDFIPWDKIPQIAIASSLLVVVAIGGYYYWQTSLNSPVTQKVPVPTKTPVAPKPETAKVAQFSIAKVLFGHTDAVWAIALSRDGNSLVSGSEDKTIKVWNLNTGEIVRTLSGHTDAIRSVAISSNGQIVSGSGDQTIKLWNLQTGQLLNTLDAHAGTVWSVATSSDGQTLVSGSEDRTIRVWNLKTGELLRTISGHSARVYSVALTPDGRTLATGSLDKTIKIWDLASGKLLRTLEGHTDAVRNITLSNDGKLLASSSWDKTVKVWNLQTGELLSTLKGHTGNVVAAVFTPDGQVVSEAMPSGLIASASLDRTIKIWDWQSGKLLRTLPESSDWLLSLAMSPSGQTLVSSSRDKKIEIWQQ